MAKALKENGWEIVSICRVRRENLMANEMLKYSSRVVKYYSSHAALYHCRKYYGGLFHVFTCYKYDATALLIKSKIGKVIFDNYDGWGGFVSEWNKSDGGRRTAAQERFCLENADGLTCRSFESSYVKWHMGYQLKGKRLLFLDYCSTESGRYKAPHQMNDPLIFFYGGGMPDEENQPDSPLSCMSDAAAIISKHSGKFLCYHPRTSDAINRYFTVLSKQNTAFRYNAAVPFDKLIDIISESDFSLMPFRKEVETNIQENTDDGQFYSVKYKYAATNKHFDSLEAGRPIVSVAPTLLFKMLARSGMAIYCPVEELDNKMDYLKEHYDEYRANIVKNVEKFSIQKNIHRLIAFYEQIKAAPPIEIDK